MFNNKNKSDYYFVVGQYFALPIGFIHYHSFLLLVSQQLKYLLSSLHFRLLYQLLQLILQLFEVLYEKSKSLFNLLLDLLSLLAIQVVFQQTINQILEFFLRVQLMLQESFEALAYCQQYVTFCGGRCLGQYLFPATFLKYHCFFQKIHHYCRRVNAPSIAKSHFPLSHIL